MQRGGRNGDYHSGFRCLIRRKKADSNDQQGGQQLARTLTAFDLIAIGIGSTIGAGVYILVGTVAREYTGPAIAISFLIAGIAAGLSAFCYAELACRCPSAGSAYHYSYICVGEGVAWLIGWSMILEFTLGGAAVARGISPNVALFFGGMDKLPAFLGRLNIYGTVVDPCAAILVLLVTGLLCTGIKESSLVQATVTTINIVALVFILIAGGIVGFRTGWKGYQISSGYFPFGINGILSGSAAVFFSYVGFDAVTSTAEEVKNPNRDMPLGIGMSVATCCIFYMLVSSVVVGLVPYNELDPDTPISSAFASYGMGWAVYIISTGTVTSLCAALMGAILPQPRILMAMARDGLLPSFLSHINKRTQVPVKGTILTGIFIAALSFLMDVSELAGMVSVGTLLGFTAVAVSVLILRYVPPGEVSVPSTVSEYDVSVSLPLSTETQDIYGENPEDSVRHPLIDKGVSQNGSSELLRRRIAVWSIALVCIGALVLSSAASAKDLHSIPRYTCCTIGGALLLCCLTALTFIKQYDDIQISGQTIGFKCPYVPFLPVVCILINTYLLINLGASTWTRVSVWLLAGALLYLFYGRKHSLLSGAILVPSADPFNTSAAHPRTD
ncbi:hypothetical protein ACET3Z_016026 [Daucus carota]